MGLEARQVRSRYRGAGDKTKKFWKDKGEKEKRCIDTETVLRAVF